MTKEVSYEECLSKTRDLLARARVVVQHKAPYYTYLLYTLMPVMCPGLGTLDITGELHLRVDPVRVALDPEFNALDANGLPQKLAGVLVHEMHHILRGIERAQALAEIDPELANIAADIPINENLRDTGWELPNWVVYPETYGFPKGLTMEGYFELLLQDAAKSKQQTRDMVAQAKGKKGKQQDNPGDSPGELDVGAGQCGDVGGNARPNPAQGQVKDVPGRSPAEVEGAKMKTAQDTKEHFAQPGRGDLPGWAEEIILHKKRRERNWVRELQNMVRRQSGLITMGGADFSLRRPSRRSLLRGTSRPGMVEQQYEAAIAIDTSGSMGQEQLTYAKNVVINVMEQTGVDYVWLAQCDARIQSPFKRTRVREVPEMPMRGRGGTNFIPIFEALKKLKPRPDMLLVLTDGDGPAPATPPQGVVVIWVIVPSYYRQKPATWGHHIVASNDHDVVEGFTT